MGWLEWAKNSTSWVQNKFTEAKNTVNTPAFRERLNDSYQQAYDGLTRLFQEDKVPINSEKIERNFAETIKTNQTYLYYGVVTVAIYRATNTMLQNEENSYATYGALFAMSLALTAEMFRQQLAQRGQNLMHQSNSAKYINERLSIVKEIDSEHKDEYFGQCKSHTPCSGAQCDHSNCSHTIKDTVVSESVNLIYWAADAIAIPTAIQYLLAPKFPILKLPLWVYNAQIYGRTFWDYLVVSEESICIEERDAKLGRKSIDQVFFGMASLAPKDFSLYLLQSMASCIDYVIETNVEDFYKDWEPYLDIMLTYLLLQYSLTKFYGIARPAREDKSFNIDYFPYIHRGIDKTISTMSAIKNFLIVNKEPKIKSERLANRILRVAPYVPSAVFWPYYKSLEDYVKNEPSSTFLRLNKDTLKNVCFIEPLQRSTMVKVTYHTVNMAYNTGVFIKKTASWSASFLPKGIYKHLPSLPSLPYKYYYGKVLVGSLLTTNGRQIIGGLKTLLDVHDRYELVRPDRVEIQRRDEAENKKDDAIKAKFAEEILKAKNEAEKPVTTWCQPNDDITALINDKVHVYKAPNLMQGKFAPLDNMFMDNYVASDEIKSEDSKINTQAEVDLDDDWVIYDKTPAKASTPIKGEERNQNDLEDWMIVNSNPSSNKATLYHSKKASPPPKEQSGLRKRQVFHL